MEIVVVHKYWKFIVLSSLLLANILYAQGPPITTETPVMLGLEGSGIRTFGKFISKENVTIYVQPLAIPYNISTKFQVGVVLPYKLINPKGKDATNGFGDVTVFAKYQLYKKDGIAKTFRILAHVKQTFPSGEKGGIPPISTNNYQTYVGLIVGRLTTSIGYYSNFGYNITSDGATDNFVYNFSVGIPLLAQVYPQKQLNTFLEFNGNYYFDSKVHTLFIAPGLQWIPGRRFLFETSFQLPIVQKNMASNKTKYTLLIGTRFLLN